MLETMMSVDEAEQAVLAAREVAPQLKIAVLFTVDEESNCLDGTSPEVAAQRMVAVGADAVGCNCSTGPAAVLSAVERMRAVTTLPIVAMPNAGMPRNVEGPQYLSHLARVHGQLCAQVCARGSELGGWLLWHDARAHSCDAECLARHGSTGCGRDGSRTREPAAATVTPDASREAAVEPPPLRERSHIGKCIADGKFLTMVEIVPPKGFDCEKELAGGGAAGALWRGCDQRAGLAARQCADERAKPLRADSAEGRHRDHSALHLPRPERAEHPERPARRGFDWPEKYSLPHRRSAQDGKLPGCDRGLRRGRDWPGEHRARAEPGLDIGRNPIGGSTGFTISAAANPGVVDIEHEVRRFAYKVEAGAEFCITQPVFDLKLLEDFLRRIEGFRIPVIAGIWPLTSVRNAEFMKNDLRVSMPDEILARMAAAPDKDAALAEGVAIAREMLESVRGSVQGVQ